MPSWIATCSQIASSALCRNFTQEEAHQYVEWSRVFVMGHQQVVHDINHHPLGYAIWHMAKFLGGMFQ